MTTDLVSSIAGAGVTGVITLIFSIIAGRFRAAKARAEKWEAVAEQQDQVIDNLKDQIRDLRTVALVQERLQVLRPKGPQSDDHS